MTDDRQGLKNAPGTDGSVGRSGVSGPAGAAGQPGADGAVGTQGTQGNRGWRGDPGVAGQPGAAGSPGTSGVKGDPGISGPAGAAGQPGAVGADGAVGTAGRPGQVGVIGPSGPAGRSAIKLTDKRMLFLYLLTVAVFVALITSIYSAQRVTNRNQSAIQHSQKQISTNTTKLQQTIRTSALNSWNGCERTRINTQKINTIDRATIAFLDAVKPRTLNLDKFTTLYRSAILTVPVCGSKPH